MTNDSKILAEAYSKITENMTCAAAAPAEEAEGGKVVYVIADTTQYDFWVYGIYSNEATANRALEELKREDKHFSPSIEIIKTPLDNEPGWNYIPGI